MNAHARRKSSTDRDSRSALLSRPQKQMRMISRRICSQSAVDATAIAADSLPMLSPLTIARREAANSQQQLHTPETEQNTHHSKLAGPAQHGSQLNLLGERRVLILLWTSDPVCRARKSLLSCANSPQELQLRHKQNKCRGASKRVQKHLNDIELKRGQRAGNDQLVEALNPHR